jgi:hypothetical protein
MRLFLAFLLSSFLIGIVMRRRSPFVQRCALLGVCLFTAAGYYFFNWL